MFLKNYFRTSNTVELSFRITVLVLGVLASFFCVVAGNLILLPVSFTAFFYFFIILPDSNTNIVGKIIIGIAFLRYCYVPITYSLPATRGLHSWYIDPRLENQLLVQSVMIIELFVVFFVEYIYFKRHPYSNSYNEQKKNNASLIRPVSFLCLFATAIIVLLYPKVIPFVNFGREPSNAIYSVFHACFIMSFLFVMEVIYKKERRPWMKFIWMVVLFSVFVLPSCIQQNSISRNLLIIYSLAFVFELSRTFPRQKKYIAIVSSALIIVGFAVLTSMKMFAHRTTASPLVGTFSLYLDYSMCNAYFAGPTNYEIGLNMISSGISGFGYLFKDLFANIPFLTSYFFEGNTVYAFNEYIFRGIAQQEITPIGIQSMIYFGPFFSWVLPALFTYLSIKTYDFANDRKMKRIGFRYPLLCFSIVFGMFQIISLNAISMLVIIMFVPPLALTFLEEVVLWAIRKIHFKKKQKNTQVLATSESVDSYSESANRTIIAKNYFFSLFHQVVLFLIPLITTPYLSQTLLSDGIGKYDFAYSISYYFVMFANFGFGYYAQRTIATKQKNKEERSKIFAEIMVCKAIFTIIPLIGFFGLIMSNTFESYNSLLWILSISIVASFFDISFLFKGMEDFKTVSIIQTIVKILTSSLFFVFVKSPNDMIPYAIILNSYSLFSCLFLFPFAKKLITFKNVGKLNIKRHLLPSFILFLPTIFGLFYTMFLRTMIGVLVQGTTLVEKSGEMVLVSNSDIENGYFSQADKLVQMGLAIVTSLGAVMASRNSSLFSSGNTNAFKKNIANVCKITLFLTIPICVGIIAISNNLVPWFFGKGYENVGTLLKYYPFLIIISGLGNIFGLQCLVAKGHYTRFTIGTLVGAIIAIGLGIPMILNFGAYGAAITSLVAETSVIITFLIFMHSNIKFKEVASVLVKYAIAGLIMFIIVNSLATQLPAGLIFTALLIVIGVIVYFLVLYFLKDRFIFSSAQKLRKKVGAIIYE